MTSPKFVGISQRVRYIELYDEFRDELDHRYIDWVIATGNIPVPIPNNLISSTPKTLYQWLETFNIQAILLSGGNDIGEFSIRDTTEQFILSWAEKSNSPVLGICRGMQFMGKSDGSELIEVSDHSSLYHTINLFDSSEQTTKKVNSYHNYSLAHCPKSYNLLATSNEGYPEAIIHKKLPWQGWMWHPERETKFHQWELLKFKELVNNE